MERGRGLRPGAGPTEEALAIHLVARRLRSIATAISFARDLPSQSGTTSANRPSP